ncbi:hypothetical protein MSAS_51880 [Mycobacterium saskatchewanense]|uniref:Uncharacterized protein n=1 Tax=Mycobacterium saskatchewanense TaxID=220927 RepID=A0A1X2C9G4_9MYCO|nr:hypothetical protein [Mycobacterium saskatchewanense]ORW72635.1 hypothetical protein AWC23_09285 [Mycobacterium saskatchewanense]BBX66014.1 hypothetical protein MSAS_51880 [Mycobacterium saskatchewanense]
MTVLAGIAALALAACVGYYFGRRSASAPSTWKRRTSRVAVGRTAIGLLVVLAARRVRRNPRAEPALRFWGPKVIAPLDLLRGGVPRVRPY